MSREKIDEIIRSTSQIELDKMWLRLREELYSKNRKELSIMLGYFTIGKIWNIPTDNFTIAIKAINASQVRDLSDPYHFLQNNLSMFVDLLNDLWRESFPKSGRWKQHSAVIDPLPESKDYHKEAPEEFNWEVAGPQNGFDSIEEGDEFIDESELQEKQPPYVTEDLNPYDIKEPKVYDSKDVLGVDIVGLTSAADFLGISAQSLNGMRRYGNGPVFKKLDHNTFVYEKKELELYKKSKKFLTFLNRAAAHTKSEKEKERLKKMRDELCQKC